MPYGRLVRLPALILAFAVVFGVAGAVITVGPGAAAAAEAKKPKVDEDRGKLLYERHCVACHGVRAGGDGPATQALVVPIPNLQGKVNADKATIDLVMSGRGPMPAYEPSFPSDDAKKVLQYMAKLTTAAPPLGGPDTPDVAPEVPAAAPDVPEAAPEAPEDVPEAADEGPTSP